MDAHRGHGKEKVSSGTFFQKDSTILTQANASSARCLTRIYRRSDLGGLVSGCPLPPLTPEESVKENERELLSSLQICPPAGDTCKVPSYSLVS